MAAKSLKTYTAKSSSVQWDNYKGVWRVNLSGYPVAVLVNSTQIAEGAPAGSKLQEVLDLLPEKEGQAWPIPAGTVSDFELTVNNSNGYYAKIDLTREAYVLIMKALKRPKAAANVDQDLHQGIHVPNATLAWEMLPVSSDLFVRGYVDNVDKQVVDGDTIYHIRVVGIGSAVQGISVGGSITVRFVGIDAPETKKADDDDYADNKNTTFARKYNITQKEAYMVAEESTNLARDLFRNAEGSVIIDLDASSDGSIVIDDYGRYVAMLYKLPVTFDQPLPGNRVVNVNKTLISNHSKLSKTVPLAMPSVTRGEEKTRFYDVPLWEHSISAGKDEAAAKLQEESKKYEAEREKMIAEERKKIQYNNEATIIGKTTHTVKKGETLEGIAKWYNTTVEKIVSANPDMTQEQLESAAKNPGSSFQIPIIETVTTSKNPAFDFEAKFDEKGQDNSLDFFESIDDRRDMETEFHLSIGDVQLLIPPLSIDVKRVSTLEKVKALRTKSSITTKTAASNTAITLQLYFHDMESINGYKVKTTNGHYYMDGLRSLIAQFKKAPFLPVRNEYLNDVHEIWNVALVNLSVASVPGFPHSIAATLTLAKFEIESFMPQEVNLDELINYPMLRWYYQEAMNDAHANNPYKTYLAPIAGDLTNEFYFEIADEDDLKERQDAIKELRFMDSPALYSEKIEQGNTEISKFLHDYKKIQACIEQQKKYKALKAEYKSRNEEFPRFDLRNKEMIMKIYGSEGFNPRGSFYPYEMGPYNPALPLDGVFQIRIEAKVTIGRIPKKYLHDAGLYKLPSDISNEIVQIIIENGKAVELQSDTYAFRYNTIKQKAEESEGTLTLQPYHISDMWLTNIQVLYENTFAPIQTQLLDTPSLQYLGSQDPMIQLSFETTERQAIEDLNHLLEETERYSREYRYGISSGFVGFQNQLTRLFGVTTVMPESMRVNTVPGYANRFEIQLTLCGFDKTQKRTESLQGFSSTFSNTTLQEREKSEDPVANDVVVLERKMKDLEVYPDLELPTYAELNAVLGSIGAGIPLYHNPNGAKYVDPDFYVSTKWTFRKYIMEERSKGQRLHMTDLAGLRGVTDSHSTDEELERDWTDFNFFTPDPGSDFGYVLDTIERQTAALRVRDPGAGNQTAPNEEIPPNPNRVPQSVLDGGQPSSSISGAIKDWSSKAANINARPSLDTWAKWNGLTTSSKNASSIVQNYELHYKNLKNPSHIDVYLEIYKNIYKTFVANGFAVPNPNENDPMNKLYGAKALKKDLKSGEYEDLTYAAVEEYRKASYQYLVQTNPSFAGKGKVPNPQGITTKQFTKLSEAMDPKGQPKITVERIANYIKALFHLRSGWKQYRENSNGRVSPLIDAGNNGVGIGKIATGLHAQSIEMAQRLAWDWKYNVEYAVQYFFEQYTSALLSKDINIRSRPWDWAVRGYSQGSFTTYNSSDAGKAERYKGALSIPDFDKFVLIFEGTVKSADYEKRKDALYNHPKSKFTSPLNPNNKAIQSYLYRNSNKSGQQTLAGTDGVQFIAGVNISTVHQNLNMLEHMQYNDVSRSQSDRLTISADDPRKLHKDMFTDMVEYDQRGRLIRAFPTFQMFIVDEGRWMTSYKLWDNLYGFNSIESIDVYKSRKMASDTAVIRMTNVYSNLTSRTLDENYGDWSYSFWDNLFWGKPAESIIEARKELADTMMLKTGARLHLRLGYGSDAGSLPVVFNGTITELDTQEVMTIIAQSDGIELTNIVSADPKETNSGWFKMITEPRDLLCQLMTSRGNWFKNWANSVTEGGLWGDTHPLGIMHFGNPLIIPPALDPRIFFNTDYGEAAQNIYSSNGANTFSQWERADGTPFGWTWGEAGNPLPRPEGDEDNIEIKLEGMTVWDIAQTMAYCSPDYIAAVIPFEMRSSLFFGKPYYKTAYRYDSTYKWIPENNNWQRTVTSEVRKPFMQYHMFDSSVDIISNQIKASEEGVYTNVIATYEGGVSKLQMADWDIRFDKQKTMTIAAPIVAQWGRDFWTSGNQANHYAQSALRDSIKDMYKGQLVLMGDPTIKPHDMCYMHDEMNSMEGPFLVKEVTHHFSFETGFITNVSPDAIVIIDDQVILSHSTWFASFGKNFAAYLIGRKSAAAAVRKLVGSSAFLRGKQASKWSIRGLGKLASYLPGGNEDVKIFKLAMRDYVDATDKISRIKGAVPESLLKVQKDNLEYMEKAFENIKTSLGKMEGKGKIGKMSTKTLLYTTENIIKGVKKGKTTIDFLRTAGTAVVRANVVALIVTTALTVITEALAEMYSREKKASQAVLMVPLQYQNRAFTAGINGHKGMVVGDDPGKWDKFFMGIGPYGGLGKALNWFAEGDVKGSVIFSTTYDDLNNGKFEKNGGLIE